MLWLFQALCRDPPLSAARVLLLCIRQWRLAWPSRACRGTAQFISRSQQKGQEQLNLAHVGHEPGACACRRAVCSFKAAIVCTSHASWLVMGHSAVKAGSNGHADLSPSHPSFQPIIDQWQATETVNSSLFWLTCSLMKSVITLFHPSLFKSDSYRLVYILRLSFRCGEVQLIPLSLSPTLYTLT